MAEIDRESNPKQTTTFANATALNTLSGSYVVKPSTVGMSTVSTDINTIKENTMLFVDKNNDFQGIINGVIYDITTGTSWNYKDQYYDEEDEVTYLRYKRLSTINSRIVNLGNILNKYYYIAVEMERALTENITIDLEKTLYFLKEDVEELPIHPIDYLLCRNYLYEIKEIGEFNDGPEEEYPGCNITLKCCAIYNGEDLSLPLSIANGGTGKGDFDGGSILFLDNPTGQQGAVTTREISYYFAQDGEGRVVLGSINGVNSNCDFYPLYDGIIIGTGIYADKHYLNNQIPIDELSGLLRLHSNVYFMPGIYTLTSTSDDLNLEILQNSKISCFGNGQIIFNTQQNKNLYINVSDNHKFDLFNIKFNCNIISVADSDLSGILNCINCDFKSFASEYTVDMTSSNFTNCIFNVLDNANNNSFENCIIYNLLDSTYGSFHNCKFIQQNIQLQTTGLVNCLLICENFQKDDVTTTSNCQHIQTILIS